MTGPTHPRQRSKSAPSHTATFQQQWRGTAVPHVDDELLAYLTIAIHYPVARGLSHGAQDLLRTYGVVAGHAGRAVDPLALPVAVALDAAAAPVPGLPVADSLNRTGW